MGSNSWSNRILPIEALIEWKLEHFPPNDLWTISNDELRDIRWQFRLTIYERSTKSKHTIYVYKSKYNIENEKRQTFLLWYSWFLH